ncbi:MAG: hypothetical protein ACK4GM_13715 [Tabrizicola sp.]
MCPDHVSIDRGINALVAGAMLSLRGGSVPLLERDTVPGGCLRTKEITLPDLRHDVTAATRVLFMTSKAGAARGPHLAWHGFDYCHTPHRTAVLRPSGEALALTTDRARNIAKDGMWSEATSEAFADRIEGILRRHIKDFDRIRLARRACSPADAERMNVSLVGGDPYGGLCTLDQVFLFRPFAHSTNGIDLVRGFTHIGASTQPGPGLGGGSGFLAAKRLGA